MQKMAVALLCFSASLSLHATKGGGSASVGGFFERGSSGVAEGALRAQAAAGMAAALGGIEGGAAAAAVDVGHDVVSEVCVG